MIEIHKFALKFFSGTLLSRISGFFRDVVMAYAFGTESAIALFMVAFRLAHLARRLFGEGSLQNTFVPLFEAKKKEHPGAAVPFFKKISFILSLSLVVFILTSIALLETVRSVFPLSSNTSTLLLLTEIMLPSLLFISLFGLNAAFLQCEKSYFIPSVAPVVFNLVWIAAALSLQGLAPEHAVIGMSFAVILACMAQWAFTLPGTKRCQAAFGPEESSTTSTASFLKPLLFANLGVAASQINNAVDPLFALYADAEGPAWLWYAIRIQQLPLALIGIAFSNAFLPSFSRLVAQDTLEEAGRTLHTVLNRTALFMIPISFLIFVTAPSCVHLLFGRGQFGSESVEGTSLCLMGYALGLLPMALVLIQAPALYALKSYRQALTASWASMAANVALNGVMVFVLGWGAAAVAVATSIAAYLNWAMLKRTLSQRLPAQTGESLKPILAASCLATLAALTGEWMLNGGSPALEVLMGHFAMVPHPFSEQVKILALEGGLFLGSFGFLHYAFSLRP